MPNAETNKNIALMLYMEISECILLVKSESIFNYDREVI